METLVGIYSLVLFLAAASLHRKHLVTPLTVFHLIWGASFLVYSLHGYLFPQVLFAPFTFDILIYYVFAFTAFFLGGAMAHFVSYFHARCAPPSFRPPANPQMIFDRKRFNTLKILCAISLLMSVVALLRNPFSLEQYLTHGDLVRTALTATYDPTAHIFSLLSSYLAFLALPLCSLIIFSSSLRWLWAYLPIAALLIVSMMSLGKFDILITCALVFNAWATTREITLRSISVLARPVFKIFALVVLLFASTATLRGNIASDVNFAKGQYPVTFLLFMYGVGDINNFSSYIASYNPKTGASSTNNSSFAGPNQGKNALFAEKTFAGAYRVLYWLGLKKSVTYTLYVGTRRFNTYSILRPLIDDFGIYGSVVTLFVFGFMSNMIFLLLDRTKPRNLVLVTLILCFVEFMPINSLFNYIFVYLMFALSPVVGNLKIGRLA